MGSHVADWRCASTKMRQYIRLYTSISLFDKVMGTTLSKSGRVTRLFRGCRHAALPSGEQAGAFDTAGDAVAELRDVLFRNVVGKR